jgi:hypothetical protein
MSSLERLSVRWKQTIAFLGRVRIIVQHLRAARIDIRRLAVAADGYELLAPELA